MLHARLGTLVTILAIVSASPVMAGGWTGRVFGGASLPMGDYAAEDKADARTGYQFGIGVGYGLGERFALGLEADFATNKHGAEGSIEDLGGGVTITAEKDKFKTLHFGLVGQAMLPTSGPLQPYGVLGLGLYDLKEDYEYRSSTGEVFTDENENAEQPGMRFGGKLGAGATYQASDFVGIGAEAAFNFVSMDEDKFGISSAQFIELRAHVTFNLMPN